MAKNVSLGSLFLVTLIDIIGLGIIIPILPLIFFETSMMAETAPYAARTFLLGLLLAIFPAAQFFGAPLLGALADRHGRKPVLLFSIMGTAMSYLLFALGLYIHSLPLLFFSRLLAGFCGGNLSVVKSIIADISDHHSKTKNFGVMGMAFGLGFIVGPFLGGVTSNPSIIPWFTITTPFLIAAFLSSINAIYVYTSLKETLDEPHQTPITMFTGISNVAKAFAMPHLRIPFIALFLFMFGFTFFTQFFPVFAYERFDYTPTQIGTIFGYAGIWIAIGQGFLSRKLAKHFPPHVLLKYSLLSVALSLLLLLLPENHLWMYAIFPFIALSNGVNHPNFSTLFSNSVDRRSQGSILGIEQSVVSLAWIFPPIISGIVSAAHPSLPILLGSMFIIVGWGVFTFQYKPQIQKE